MTSCGRVLLGFTPSDARAASGSPNGSEYRDYQFRFDFEAAPVGAGLGVRTDALRRHSIHNYQDAEIGSWLVSNEVDTQAPWVDAFQRPRSEGPVLGGTNQYVQLATSYDATGNVEQRTLPGGKIQTLVIFIGVRHKVLTSCGLEGCPEYQCSSVSISGRPIPGLYAVGVSHYPLVVT